MSAEKVVEKILAQAKTQADEIRASADTASAAIAKETSAKLTDFEAETTQLKQKAFDEAKSRVLASARMETAKANLKMKKDLIDNVFAKAADIFRNMEDGDYIELMSKLVVVCVERGDEQIVVGKNETRLGDDFLNNVNAKLGEKGRLTFAENTADIDAGFILQREKVRINVSLAVLLSQAKENLETELAAELFN